MNISLRSMGALLEEISQQQTPPYELCIAGRDFLGLYAEDRDGPSVPGLIGDENPNPQVAVVFVVPGYGESEREDEVEVEVEAPIPGQKLLEPPRPMVRDAFGVWRPLGPTE
jgi:hypothetical protein